jgi:hypothetical protein
VRRGIKILFPKSFLLLEFALDAFGKRAITGGMSTDALLLPDPALLPDDPAVLKQLVMQLLEELHKANERLERQEHHMHLLLKRLYGSTSEKFDPRQGMLFDPLPAVADSASGVPPPVSPPVSKKRDRHGRGRITSAIRSIRSWCSTSRRRTNVTGRPHS